MIFDVKVILRNNKISKTFVQKKLDWKQMGEKYLDNFPFFEIYIYFLILLNKYAFYLKINGKKQKFTR